MKGNDAKRLEVLNHIESLAHIVTDIKEKVSRNRTAYSCALEDRIIQLNSELVRYEQTSSRLVAMKGPERLLKNQEISGTLTDLSEGVLSCERTNVWLVYFVRCTSLDSIGC
ncbi:hypothetical protein PTI98_006853 [Pleurotus ostreatus]|nr:hypothetical protein PTI98_006853 [Pleurotus ostreatus]